MLIDADGHVTETSKQVEKYLEEPYRSRSRHYQENALFPRDGADRRLFGRFTESAPDAETWLAALDRGGLDATVLYPTLGLWVSFLKDKAWAVAVCRAYNTFLSEEFAKASGRLKGVGILPVQDPAAAVVELRRCAEELGFAAVMLHADGQHLLGDEKFHPIYEAAQNLNLPVAVHASGTGMAPGLELFKSFLQAHILSHPSGIMRQLTSMVMDGVPERFPRLKIAYLEAGCGWVPWLMGRMDEEYEKRGDVEAPGLTRKPSEYLRGGNIYFSCEADECLLPQAVQMVGEGQIVYASDFPHWDNSYPQSVGELRGRGDLTEAQKKKLLGENAARLYNLG